MKLEKHYSNLKKVFFIMLKHLLSFICFVFSVIVIYLTAIVKMHDTHPNLMTVLALTLCVLTWITVGIRSKKP